MPIGEGCDLRCEIEVVVSNFVVVPYSRQVADSDMVFVVDWTRKCRLLRLAGSGLNAVIWMVVCGCPGAK